MSHVTTDDTIGRDLRASLALLEGVPAGITWGAFKAAMTVLGVTDGDRLSSIDYTGGTGRILREDGPDGIDIKEMR